MDYGWETSEDEGGMEIDLDAKQEEQSLRKSGTDKEDGSRRTSLVEDYDPSEPTDDYDPSEPTKDYDPETSNKNQQNDINAKLGHSSLRIDQKYDPAEPTMSDEDASSKEEACHLSGRTNKSENTDEEENDGRWDSQMPLTQEEGVPSSGEENAHDDEDNSSTNNRDQSNSVVHDGDQEDDYNDLNQNVNSSRTKSESPSIGPLDMDENTHNSLLDDIDVSDVSFDESDFVLEKEPFEKENEQCDSTQIPGKGERKVKIVEYEEEDNINQEERESESPNSERRHSYSQDEDRERFRRQEEVDTRNEEALVDLFREESDADKIEEDIAQPEKKTKKLMSKKLKKKGKKLKKDQSKKSNGKLLNESVVEDQRFVEIRRERQSTEVREEGELEGDVVHRKSYEERVSLDMYEQTFDIGTGNQEDEQREPGEIVEEGKKKWKKRDKKEKKKKKSKREVATIEEGNQGDDDSQKFPSFLAGFFVQDEGGEDEMEENLHSISRSYENGEERTFQKGGKTYRKRHSSEAEDSVKSLDQNLNEDQEIRTQEPDHRRNRKHEERRHESRDKRQHEVRDIREVRREREHHHGTPRERERERDRERERSRGERERERVRIRDRERERERDREREREREREVVWDRDRDRSRRVEIEERRGHRARSGSHENRRRIDTSERVRRSRSRDRSARRRRHRSKSQERSNDREKEREKEREKAKRRHQERSHDREVERRVRRVSRSRSPRHRSERAGSNKENREESHRRRRHVRTQEESESDQRNSGHRRHRRERREPERSSSASSSSASTDSNTRRRRSGHRYNFSSHHSSDEGASSDVILVEPERIVINLDEEEDPPSRVDITHANAEDDSTKLVDGESIPPPPDLSKNSRGSALIQINPAQHETEDDQDEQEGDATPTRDEHNDEVQPRWNDKLVQESDYDPAHPTEEGEDQDSRSSTPNISRSPALAPAALGPVPPDHPPPRDVRPSPPPGPSLVEPGKTVQHSQQSPMSGGPRPQLTHISPFQQQPAQQQQTLLPFQGNAGGPGQAQRFPQWSLSNGPNSNMLPQNSGLPPGFPPGQRGLLPTPDTRPLFSAENSRSSLQFGPSLPHLSHPPSLRESVPQQINSVRPLMPLSAMAPLAQLTSLLPGLDRAKMSAYRDEHSISQSSQILKHTLPTVQSSLIGKGPLVSSSGTNMSSGLTRSARGVSDLSESTEVVDMDMSPGEDDCELELPSPISSESDRDDRRRRGRKSDSRMTRTTLAIDKGKGSAGADKGLIQPAMYLKALSKAIEKLTPKVPTSTAGPAASSHEKSKTQVGRKKKVDANEDDVPASAVDLTNKEKYLKKLHLQERVIDEVKLAIKPFYSAKKITKEQYKLILRKAVPKVCHSKSGNINPQKIQQLVEAYVNKIQKGKMPGGNKKKKHHPAKEVQASKETAPVSVRQNGEWAKKSTR